MMVTMTKELEQTGKVLPEGWKWVKLGDICETSTQNCDPRKKPNQSFHYIDISSVDNITKQIIEPKFFVGKDAPSRARQIVKYNDLLVSTTRPNLNAVALVPENLSDQICSTGFCILRSSSDLDPYYLFQFVKSSEFVKNLSNLVKGALYPAVTDKQVLDQLIALPPLAEQKRIVAILNEKMAAIEKAKTATLSQLEAINALPAAILKQAFNGEL